MVTLDLDFADIRRYPPEEHAGIIVLRVELQSRQFVLQTVRQILPLLLKQPLPGRLWLVDEGGLRVRVRGD